MYKLSKFNVVTKVDCDTYALYNTNSCALAKLTQLQRDEVFSVEFVKGERCQDTELRQELIANGLVVERSCDEELSILQLEQHMSNPEILSLIILPTENCNFRCVYCYEEHRNNAMSDASYDAMLSYIKGRSDLKQLNLSWFGGEPLLQVNQIVRFGKRVQEYCASLNIKFGQAITTNGYLLTGDVFEQLVDTGVSQYQVTVDGLELEHDSKRYLANKSGTWHRIIHNLTDLSNTTREFELTLRYNYDNNSDVNRFLGVYQKLFGDDDRFVLHVVPVGDWSATDTTDTSRVTISKSAILSQARKRGISVYATESFKNTFSMICYANFETSMVIMPDLSVRKCTVKLDSDYNHIGTINSKGELVLDRDKLQLWTKAHVRLVCRDCPVKPMCLSRYCPLRAQESSDTECKYQVYLLKSIANNNIIRLGG